MQESLYLKRIACLDLRATSITDEGIAALCKGPNVTHLKELDVSMNGKQITDETLRALAYCKYLQFFKRLRIANCSITDEGIKDFCFSSNAADIRELDISNDKDRKNANRITDLTLRFFGDTSYLTYLKRVNLRGTDVTPDGLHHFFSSYNCQNL